MSNIAVILFLVLSLILAMLLALLGIETLASNILGWFLLLLGVVYIAWVGVVYFFQKERFWESVVERTIPYQASMNVATWLIPLAMMAVFYSSPLEYLYLKPILPRVIEVSVTGIGLVIIGIVIITWARRTIQSAASTQNTLEKRLIFVQDGPYKVIRNPAYAGYLLVAMGVSLGYSSLAGIAATFILLFPSLIFQMKMEEKSLAEQFGDVYILYLQRTKRLIPGIW